MENIVKNLIKDNPQIANKHFSLIYENKEKNIFAVGALNEAVLVVTNIPTEVKSISDWKKQMIADHIYMAATMERSPTIAEVANIISKILDTTTYLFDLK